MGYAYDDTGYAYDDAYGAPAPAPRRLPPKAKRKKSSKPALKGSGNEPPTYDHGGSKRTFGDRLTESGVMGGLVAMAIAVIWFFGGLFFGVCFFYPPILFVLGAIAVVRGLLSD